MLRFFINLILVVIIAVFISQQDGTLHLVRGDTTVDLNLQTGLALLIIILLWWWGIAKVWFFIKYGFDRRADRRLRKQREEGLVALTLALNALAGGDQRTAHKALRRARKLLGDAPMVLWLEAELATRKGDGASALQHYQQLATMREGTVLGWRGLLQQQPRHDITSLLRLTQDALAVSAIAKQDFAYELQIMAYAQQGNWADAAGSLRNAKKNKAMPLARIQKLESIIELKLGEVATLHDTDNAMKHFRNAQKILPGFVPIATQYAAFLLDNGDKSLANKIIAATWLLMPHLDLLRVFQTVNDNDDALKQLQSFERFAAKQKNNVATPIALGRLSLKAKLHAKAIDYAETAVNMRPVREAFMLLSDCMTQNAPQEAREAERRAVDAPSIGVYICEACNHTSGHWSVICPQCHKVATMDWDDEPNIKLATSPVSLLR